MNFSVNLSFLFVRTGLRLKCIIQSVVAEIPFFTLFTAFYLLQCTTSFSKQNSMLSLPLFTLLTCNKVEFYLTFLLYFIKKVLVNFYLALFYLLTGMDIFLECLEQKIGIFCMRFYGFQNVLVPSIFGLASPKYFLNLEI